MAKPVTPLLAADTIIALIDLPERPFVLIERAFPPYGWAIPGGFVDVDETVEHAAIREAKEEVGLDVRLIALLGIYSDPKRDARGHTVTACYVAEAHGMPKAADDAKNCGIFTFANLPEALAFDHAEVLADYRNFLTSGKVAPLSM
ncbi:NUDIX hydrolase [Methylomicrobium sp. Wu6]|uniref:NUDIX hydrolase n=1 Tax=Methylomicrobium sp. Wu6 TaxID=3107928 RepID=UPI002DD62B5C|nr:NUDIX hydrolase [Methylomicrobium sp. Wu6]MEC4747433.1 NUDIX hydrolase [Methylomicrobium sp. Wu6]